MLTPTQVSMLKYCLKSRISALFHFYQDEKDVCDKTVQILNVASAHAHQDKEVDCSHMQQHPNIYQPRFIDLTVNELRGIFYPNFAVLSALAIINNTRDTTTLSESEFTTQIDAFTKQALIVLKSLIEKTTTLNSRIQDIVCLQRLSNAPLLSNTMSIA
jgi:hypothetical protein